MFATLFEWRVKTGREEMSVRLWSAGMKAIRVEGSIGSALLGGRYGRLHACARWPGRAARDRAFAKSVKRDMFEPFADCIEETLRRLDLDLKDERWASPSA
jgi:hypothetical protein